MQVLPANADSADDRVARALVLLAAGQAEAAAKEARAAVASPSPDPSEMGSSEDVSRRGNEVLGRALIRLGRRSEGLAALQLAASMGSARAREDLVRAK